jgi:hypothetical protein
MDFYIKTQKKFVKPLYVATVPVGSNRFARIVQGVGDEGLEIRYIEKKSARDGDIRIIVGGGESYREELEENLDEREHYGKKAEVREHRTSGDYQADIMQNVEQRKARAVGRTRFVVPDAEVFRLLTRRNE